MAISDASAARGEAPSAAAAAHSPDGLASGAPNVAGEIVDGGLVGELVQMGLLTPTRIVREGAQVRLEQPERLASGQVSEMPFSMRRDAAIALLKLARVLDSRGYALTDGDMRGFCVDRNGRPRFFDVDAVRPKGNRKFSYAEFHAACFAPLRLTAWRPELAELTRRAGVITIDEDLAIRRPWLSGLIRWLGRLGAVGRRIAGAYRRFVVLSPFAGLLHCGMYGTFLRAVWRERAARRARRESAADWTGAMLERLDRKLRRIDEASVTQRWTNYYSGYDLPAIASAGGEWPRHYRNPRSEALIEILGDGGGRTLLDVGANQGYYSMLGAHLGFEATAVDYDLGCVDGLYRMLRDAGHPLSVRPLLMNFVELTPDQARRLAADATLALGFVHHMRLVELLPWDAIADRLSQLTREVLVTEFKAGTKARGAKDAVTPEIEADYTIDNLCAALQRRFASVEILGAHVAPGGSTSPRDMIVCRR